MKHFFLAGKPIFVKNQTGTSYKYDAKKCGARG